ncbi:uncharacterized protein ACBT44_013836 [Syngnathus typhle]
MPISSSHNFLEFLNLNHSISEFSASNEDTGGDLFESTTPSQDQQHWRDVEDSSQWQCEFRGQIRALRQWLMCMEMRLPSFNLRGNLFRPQGGRGVGESGFLCLVWEARLHKCLSLEALCSHE